MDHRIGVGTFQAVVLAAGGSSRFKTGRTKLVEKICGREMVLYPLEVFAKLNIPTLMVVGFQRDTVEQAVKEHFDHHISFIHQEEQRGTGHAIACTRDAWQADTIIVINGDMPLVTQDIIEKLIKKHTTTGATLTFATAHHCDPEALYGRVIQADDKIRIIEAKDFEGDLTEQCCVNAGIYLIKRDFLTAYIDKLNCNNASKEWYITDLIKLASDSQLKVVTVTVPFDRIRGVNDFKELWAAEQIKKSEIIQHWMGNGVRFSIAHNVQIDWNVTIGAGSFIDSGVALLCGTKIGTDCMVEAGCVLNKSIVGDRTIIYPNTILDHAQIGSDAKIGPFSYIHGNSVVGNHATVGSFVELNRTHMSAHAKAKHLSYLGDTQVGQGANLGAGLIVCNFDGTNKYQTVVKDQAFVGGNSTLVAPVSIGAGAVTAAGSTITEDVPDNALAIARERQTNKPGYAPQLRDKQQSGTKQKWSPTRKQQTVQTIE